MTYLLYGEDTFLIEQFVKKIKKSFGELQNGINFIQVDEKNVNNIIQDIETPAFGFDKKLIIAKNCNLFIKKNLLADKVADYISNNNIDDVELIFIETKAEKNNLYNVIEKEGTIKQFKELTISELIKQIKSIASAYGVNIKENTASYLIECTGNNMQNIINELRKLIEYVGSGKEILKEDIDILTIKRTESVIFDLTDSLGNKKIKEAMDILQNLKYNKEPTQMILIMLYRHFKKLYIVHLCNGNNIAQNLKLKPNQTFLTRKYSMQASYFKEIELRTILDEFIRLDENSKNGNIDLDIGLDAVLCNYCS